MTEELKPSKEDIIEARTTYNVHKEETKQIMEEWKKYLEMKPNDFVEGALMAGVIVQLIKQTIDKVTKYNKSSETYIEKMENRLEHDVLLSTKM